MNPGDHETITSPWEVIRRPNEGDYMEMRITSTVEGCPYDFTVVTKMTQLQMAACPDPKLGSLKTEQEIEAQSLVWDRIFILKKLVMTQPVHDWNLEDWVKAAPFLFKDAWTGKPLDADILDEEAMQKVRDGWV